MCENVLYNAVGNQINSKTRLLKYLDGADRDVLDPEMLCSEDQCALGQWIHGDGLQYGHIPAFNALKELHGNLHKCTTDVLMKSDSGERQAATGIFQSEYIRLSKRITHTLVRLNSILNGYNNKLFV